jgi:hypothetical protein
MSMDLMFDVVLRFSLVAATSFLFIIVLLTYIRLKSTKMLLISTGFGVFLINSLIHLPELFFEWYDLMLSENVYLLVHLIGLIFITLGLLKD